MEKILNNGEFDINKVEKIESDFANLTPEEKQAFLKSLIWGELAHDYVDRKAAAYKRGVFSGPSDVISEENAQKYRDREFNKTSAALGALLETMFGEDDELKFRIFSKFIDAYSSIEYATRKEICRYDHDYSDWKKTEGVRPQFSLDGDIEGTCWGKFSKRVCEYCGTSERAYSEESKKYQENEAEKNAKLFPRKYIYTMPPEETQN